MNTSEAANKQIETATELRAQFFFHWSLLSAGTLSLLIPLLTQIKTTNSVIVSPYYLQISIVLLICSLSMSSVRNFIAAQGFWMVGNFNLKSQTEQQTELKDITKKLNIFKYIQWTNEILSIIGYIMALVFLFLFISDNLIY